MQPNLDLITIADQVQRYLEEQIYPEVSKGTKADIKDGFNLSVNVGLGQETFNPTGLFLRFRIDDRDPDCHYLKVESCEDDGFEIWFNTSELENCLIEDRQSILTKEDLEDYPDQIVFGCSIWVEEYYELDQFNLEQVKQDIKKYIPDWIGEAYCRAYEIIDSMQEQKLEREI